MIYLHYHACPWRDAQKVKGQHRFLSDLSNILLIFHVPLYYTGHNQRDDLFNVTLLIQFMATFLLAFINLFLLSRNKWATSCSHWLSALNIIKQGTTKNCFRKNTDLVITYDTKYETAILVFLSGFFYYCAENLRKGTRMDQREIISLLLCQRLLLSFHNSTHPGVFKTTIIITRQLFL